MYLTTEVRQGCRQIVYKNLFRKLEGFRITYDYMPALVRAEKSSRINDIIKLTINDSPVLICIGNGMNK